MARTLNGNMTGRAAAEQRVEDREIGTRVDMSELRMRLKQKETDACARCVVLEGKIPFYAWYASVDGSISKRVELIEERIAFLEGVKIQAISDALLSAKNSV